MLRQYDLNQHFLSPTCKCRCTVDHQPGSDSGVSSMGRQARATAEASLDSKLVVEKGALHQHVPHGPSYRA